MDEMEVLWKNKYYGRAFGCTLHTILVRSLVSVSCSWSLSSSTVEQQEQQVIVMENRCKPVEL